MSIPASTLQAHTDHTRTHDTHTIPGITHPRTHEMSDEESNKVSQTLQTFIDNPSKSLNELVAQPCFKKSILWGTSLAGLLAAHRFHSSRSMVKTLDSSVLGFLVGSGASWFSCRTTRSAEKRKLDEALGKLNELQRRTAGAREDDIIPK